MIRFSMIFNAVLFIMNAVNKGGKLEIGSRVGGNSKSERIPLHSLTLVMYGHEQTVCTALSSFIAC